MSTTFLLSEVSKRALTFSTAVTQSMGETGSAYGSAPSSKVRSMCLKASIFRSWEPILWRNLQWPWCQNLRLHGPSFQPSVCTVHVCANDKILATMPRPDPGKARRWTKLLVGCSKNQHTKHNHPAQPPSTTRAFVASQENDAHHVFCATSTKGLLTTSLQNWARLSQPPHDPILLPKVHRLTDLSALRCFFFAGHSSSTKVVTSEGKEPVGWLGVMKHGFLDDALSQVRVWYYGKQLVIKVKQMYIIYMYIYFLNTCMIYIF